MKKIFALLVLYFCCISARCQYNTKIIVETLLKTDTSYAGQKLVYPSGDSTETTIVKVTIPAGASTDWHKHDYPLYGYIIQGELSVERKGQPPFLMKAGAAYAEVTGTWHNGTNKSNKDCVMIVFFTGIHNHPLSIKQATF